MRVYWNKCANNSQNRIGISSTVYKTNIHIADYCIWLPGCLHLSGNIILMFNTSTHNISLEIVGNSTCVSLVQHWANSLTYTDVLLIQPLGTNFSEIRISTRNKYLEMIYFIKSSSRWRPFYLGFFKIISSLCVIKVTTRRLRMTQYRFRCWLLPSLVLPQQLS